MSMIAPIELYIVNESSVKQMSRIRQNLHRYQYSFLTLSYITETGAFFPSSYDIWINLCLITSKVRPSFIIKWTDYLDPNVFEYIMTLLTNYRDSLDDQDIDYRLLFITDVQGIIVTTYYSYYKNGLRKIIADYLSSNRSTDSSPSLLSLILGYPNINDNEEHHELHTFSLHLSGTRKLLENIYFTSQSRDKLYEFYSKVVSAVKVYDRECLILLHDTQGSLVSPDATYLPFHMESVHITDDLNNKYQTYINDPLRLEKNWNDNFDRIFEIGYCYNNRISHN